jgi:hypothetical protein
MAVRRFRGLSETLSHVRSILPLDIYIVARRLRAQPFYLADVINRISYKGHGAVQ